MSNCKKCGEITYKAVLSNNEEFYVCMNKDCELYNVVCLADNHVEDTIRKEFLNTEFVISKNNVIKVLEKGKDGDDWRDYEEVAVVVNNKNEFDILKKGFESIGWKIRFKNYQEFHNEVYNEVAEYHNIGMNNETDKPFIEFNSDGGRERGWGYRINVIEAIKLIDYLKNKYSDRLKEIKFKIK